MHENNCEIELADPRLHEFNKEEVKRIIRVGLLCTQTAPSLRPTMSKVVAMLSGDMKVCQVTTKPGYLTNWRYDDTTGSYISFDNANAATDVTYTSSTNTADESNQSREGDT